MNNTILQPISFMGLCLGLVLIALTIGLTRWNKLPLTKELIIGAARTMGQLFLVGAVLQAIFNTQHWYWVLGYILVMILVASHTARQRLGNHRFKTPYSHVAVALLIGAGITILWVNEVILHIHPWYHPQFLIPLAGMIIGNSMNSASLALDRFFNEVRLQKPQIETLLSLGANGSQAAENALKSAISAALIPNINAMMVVGIVSLPGMMTGQILAGQSPLSAITYQIIVMFMITCASTLTSVMVTHMALRQCFNEALQITL